MSWRTRKRGTLRQVGKKFQVMEKKKLPPKISMPARITKAFASKETEKYFTSGVKGMSLSEMRNIAEEMCKKHDVPACKVKITNVRGTTYSPKENTVYLSRSYLSVPRDIVDSVIRHEVGHHIDFVKRKISYSYCDLSPKEQMKAELEAYKYSGDTRTERARAVADKMIQDRVKFDVTRGEA